MKTIIDRLIETAIVLIAGAILAGIAVCSKSDADERRNCQRRCAPLLPRFSGSGCWCDTTRTLPERP